MKAFRLGIAALVLLLCPLVICRAQEPVHYINYRSSLDNSFYKMGVEKKATVAFLGGSITQMKGWHELVMADLQARFPDTEFKFIEAGISSLGSTPHAFRFEQDVLEKGTPDLLFVEAAVNDHTNEFGPVEQVRAMEGIVRHALRVNPKMDIMMLHFIYDPFIPMLESGQTPDVILNHERVANHYHITSINHAQEISDLMVAGTLTWKEFGGTHPAPAGHKLYMDAIATVFNNNPVPAREYVLQNKVLPEEPLDAFCYERGHLVSIAEAESLKGFGIVDPWEPSVEGNTRGGFHAVPMLSADKLGSSFKLRFHGTAVGIFCVAGPDCAVLQYRIDGGDWKILDPYTQWSRTLYLPWLYMLGAGLEEGDHLLQVKLIEGEDKAGVHRTGCHIRNFAVN